MNTHTIEFAVHGATAAEIEAAARGEADRYFGTTPYVYKIDAAATVRAQNGEVLLYEGVCRAWLRG